MSRFHRNLGGLGYGGLCRPTGLVLGCLLAVGATSASHHLQAAPPPEGPGFADVFIAGKDGFKSIRIPSVVVSKKGTVLAIAEGRAQHADQANNKLILKRSADGGQILERHAGHR